jgi:hypothetical protein
MSPTPQSPVISHARQSLDRARNGVTAVRPKLADADARNLESGLAALVESLARLESASDGQLAQCWSQFFGCYDRLLALLRTFENGPPNEGDPNRSAPN